MVASDGQGVPVGRISRRDVAALCVAALESAKAGHATLSCVSGAAGKRKNKEQPGGAVAVALEKRSPSESSRDVLAPYKLLLRKVGRPDASPLRKKPHRLAVALFLLGFSVAAAGAAALVAQVVGLLLATLRCVAYSFLLCDPVRSRS